MHGSVEMSESETCLWCPRHAGFSLATWLDNLSKPESLKAESVDVCQMPDVAPMPQSMRMGRQDPEKVLRAQIFFNHL